MFSVSSSLVLAYHLWLDTRTIWWCIAFSGSGIYKQLFFVKHVLLAGRFQSFHEAIFVYYVHAMFRASSTTTCSVKQTLVLLRDSCLFYIWVPDFGRLWPGATAFWWFGRDELSEAELCHYWPSPFYSHFLDCQLARVLVYRYPPVACKPWAVMCLAVEMAFVLCHPLLRLRINSTMQRSDHLMEVKARPLCVNPDIALGSWAARLLNCWWYRQRLNYWRDKEGHVFGLVQQLISPVC